VVNAITAKGGKAVAIKGDVALKPTCSPSSRRRQAGTPEVLINNAGIMGHQNRLDEMETERLAAVRHQHPRLLPLREGGREAHVDEAWRLWRRHRQPGLRRLGPGRAGLGIEYAASKGAIDVLTIGLGREVAAEGIRVNAVRPGIIDTEIHDSSGIPGRVKLLRDVIPMKREGKAEEVADAILWLCSDQSSYVTGSIIPVAGGRC
jgi:NAD(P)-dependent dehydrogenase (short-subunit alcohol dehydrogenase family)